MNSPRHQDPNQNRPGYKKTKVGWIPEKWDVRRLQEIAEVQTGLAKGKSNSQDAVSLPYLRVANVQDGHVVLDDLKSIEVERSQIERYRLRKDDVLFTEGGDFDKLGRGCVWDAAIDPCLHQNHVFAVRCNQDIVSPYFLASVASSTIGRRYFTLSSKQSTNLASINSTQLKIFPVPLPMPREQIIIMEILSTWNKAIEQLRKLIEARKRRKQGLMQQLLIGKKRLPGFRGKWRNIQLGKLFKPVRRPLEWDDEHFYSLLSVRRRSGGVFLRERLQGCKIQTKVMFEAHAGDFLISKMQVLHGATGLVPKELDGTHISGSYIALRPINDDQIDPDFFARLSSTPEFYHLSYLSSYGVHIEKMTFNLRWFLREKVSIPENIEEQQAIAAVLQTADEEVANLEAQLAALESQKRGLMQKLLTGTVRVKF